MDCLLDIRRAVGAGPVAAAGQAESAEAGFQPQAAPGDALERVAAVVGVLGVSPGQIECLDRHERDLGSAGIQQIRIVCVRAGSHAAFVGAGNFQHRKRAQGAADGRFGRAERVRRAVRRLLAQGKPRVKPEI